MRFTTFTLTLLVSFSAFSQDINYARAVLDTLCSERYDGRGFYNNGERRAANFIQKEFEKFGLKTFEDSWFQKFKLSVSSIVGETKLSLDGNTLTPGADYIIDPASPTYAGNAKVLILKKSQLTDTDKFLSLIHI